MHTRVSSALASAYMPSLLLRPDTQPFAGNPSGALRDLGITAPSGRSNVDRSAQEAAGPEISPSHLPCVEFETEGKEHHV